VTGIDSKSIIESIEMIHTGTTPF